MLQKVVESARVRIISDDLEALRKIKKGEYEEVEEGIFNDTTDKDTFMDSTIYRENKTTDSEKAYWVMQAMSLPVAIDLEEEEEEGEEGGEDAPVDGGDDAPVDGGDDTPVDGGDDAPVDGDDDQNP